MTLRLLFLSPSDFNWRSFAASLSIAFFLGFCGLTIESNAQTTGSSVSFSTREEAYRANNLGVAFLEQYDHANAVESFRRALSIDSDLKIARVNLAIAFFNLQNYENSLREARIASESAPGLVQPVYILGLVARAQNRFDDAIAAFKRVLELDPNDVGANVNLGQIYMQQRKFEDAIGVFRTAVAAEPYNSTAVYNLATALLRHGARDEGQSLMTRFQSLRQSGAATSLGQNYLEQGRYAEALVSSGAEPELVDAAPPNVTFRPTDIGLTEPRSRPVARNSLAALIDIDGDGDLDITKTAPARVFRNDGGKFTDVTSSSGDFAKAGNLNCTSIIAGDYDNDRQTDLFVSWKGRFALYRNLGSGRFQDVTRAAKIPGLQSSAATSAFADIDHDGDLDIALGLLEKASTVLFRNNGDGTFTDISRAAKLDLNVIAGMIIPTDFDNRRDMDLFVLPGRGAPMMLRNLRNGTFENVAAEVGLGQQRDLNCAAVGDFNKDSYVDFFFGRFGKPGVFAVSDGRGKFIYKDASATTANAKSALFLDYDNDGLVDLIVNTTKGLVLSRNLGDRWSDATSQPFKTNLDLSAPKQILAADLDSDGHVDLLLPAKNGSVQFLRNDGGNTSNSELVRLQGRVSNRNGIGSKIEMRAGSLTQKLESYSASPMPAPAELHFGLGKRAKPDAVRIIWPSGVIQAEVEFSDHAKNRIAARRLNVEELDRKPSSCPYLYTWNGEKFEFITDFMGGGELGAWAGPGAYHNPDPDEFVRIPPGKLKPKDGKYEIRVTNELEEVLFVDQLKLIAIEHDAETEVYPNEGLGIPTAGKRVLYTTSGEHPPVLAVNSRGKNVLPEITELDRKFYDSFKSTDIRGYAEPHSLTMNLDNKKGYSGRTLLLLTGWTDYAFSSDNVAASQSGKSLSFPKLQVKNKQGEWQTVIDSIGISVGRPQTIVVDLTGRFLSESREVRIVTNVKTYWDKIAVETSEQQDVKTTEIRPRRAELRERGFSVESNFGGMIVPDYDKVISDGRWKYFSGRLTRTGDVGALLERIDDVFVISKTGDELALDFDALPDPPAGKKYTFLLYADGYSKEMDINSGSPETVLPLPFKAMSRYPYGPDETFPMTEEKRRIYDEYTTRSVRAVFPRIETIFVGNPK